MRSVLTRIATLSVLLTALTFVVQGTASAHTLTANHQAIPAAFSQSCPATQQTGSSGALVQVIQFRLNALNESGDINHSFGNPFPLATDGSFGALTKEAVQDFQAAASISTDGSVGPQTWSSMGFCTGAPHITFDLCCVSSSTSHALATLQEGSSGDLVRALQSALNMDANNGQAGKGSWFPLTVDGSFGNNTKAAVLSFQAQQGLKQDGSVGPQTWGAFWMDY